MTCTPLSAGKTTSNAGGSFGIMLETADCPSAGGAHEGYAFITIPVTSKPLYLNGFYRSLRVGQAPGFIDVSCKNNNNEIGSGTLTIPTTVNNYTAFSLPITYTSNLTPTSIFIFLGSEAPGQTTLGNRLWVDELSFSNTALSVDEIDDFLAPQFFRIRLRVLLRLV